MSKLNQKSIRLAALSVAGALAACVPTTDEGAASVPAEQELSSTNGLSMLNGLSLTNGLSGNGLSGNGLSGNGLLMNPLTTGILSSGSMMNTTGGRTTMSYIVRCALAAGKTITAKDQNNVSYSFAGQIGVAPEWELTTCGTTCQERMTACLLAHVNTSGVHIPIWLDGEGAIGWGQNVSFPYQEGSFFGNVFVNPPKGYYCDGKDFASGTVPGRLGVGQTNAPYTNPFGTPSLCSSYCFASTSKTNNVADGYSACFGYTHVVTVWRNFDVNTQYKIVNKQNGKALTVGGSSTVAGAVIAQSTYAGTASQKWTITQIAAGKYKVVNVNSGKALDLAGASTADGAGLIQSTYSGAASQLWAFQSLADQAGNYEVSPSSKLASTVWPVSGLSGEGAPVQVTTYNTNDSQKWQIVPL